MSGNATAVCLYRHEDKVPPLCVRDKLCKFTPTLDESNIDSHLRSFLIIRKEKWDRLLGQSQGSSGSFSRDWWINTMSRKSSEVQRPVRWITKNRVRTRLSWWVIKSCGLCAWSSIRNWKLLSTSQKERDESCPYHMLVHESAHRWTSNPTRESTKNQKLVNFLYISQSGRPLSNLEEKKWRKKTPVACLQSKRKSSR